MRLLIVSSFFESHRGGLEIVAGRLAREFQRAGHSVAWLASDASAPPPPGVCARSISVQAFNGTERSLGIPFPLPAPAALAAIHREVQCADAVLLHDAAYPTSIAAYLFARWSNTPVMITQHIDIVPYRNPVLSGVMKLMTHLVTRPILAGAGQVVFISKTTARAFESIGFRRPPQLIFNGLDTELFHPACSRDEKMAARRRFGLPLDRPVALFVGRFVEKKGLGALQHAARGNPDMVWAFAGWGHLDPRQWGLPNVHVLSDLSQESLAPLYRASDAFVLPSVGEGYPLVLQEALACGLPAVCGMETAQAADNLAPLVHAIAIDDSNAENTAEHLVRAARAAIAADTPLRAAERSRLIRGGYSWPRAARRYLDLFAALSNEPAATPRFADAVPVASMKR